MADSRPLFIPIVLGTVRKGRRSEPAAHAVLERVRSRPGVETELIDVAALHLPNDDAGEQIKNPTFAERMTHADGLIVVTPEYNRGYPGMLKHLLDSCLKEYIHKPVGVVGVSAGPWGGTRVIENLLPVMRELGLVTIFWDVNFTHSYKTFHEGVPLDPAYGPRIDKFLNELVWMAKTLRYGRENIALAN
ncbi:MAG TPA: NAD(P)H-dependent oxidoreductase [Candidatus Eisenbacteria bacterium]|nr:NAD(P)H-dependent oxidoreductase [Candidatus Eisenbacteria bacterium]